MLKNVSYCATTIGIYGVIWRTLPKGTQKIIVSSEGLNDDGTLPKRIDVRSLKKIDNKHIVHTTDDFHLAKVLTVEI